MPVAPAPSRCVRGPLLALVAGLVLVSPPATPPAVAGSTVITTRVSDTTPAYGEAVRIKGRVTGRRPGSSVHLRVMDDADATRVATATLKQDGRYAFWWTPPLELDSRTRVLQVAAPKTRRKAESVGDFFVVTPDDAPFDVQTLRPTYLQIVNDARAEVGLPPLTMVDEYTQIANGVARELHERGSYPEDVFGRFPSNVFDLGVCAALDTGRHGYSFQASDVDLTPEAVYFAVGIHELADDRATVVMYTLAVNPSGR